MTQPDLFDVGRPSIRGTADISPCGRYRFALSRSWDDGEGVVNFVMLNPSVADATRPDPTLTRCMGFARAWGYGSLVITNLFAWRASGPEALKGRDPAEVIGPENDHRILLWARTADLVVLAWGNHGLLYGRAEQVRRLLAMGKVRPHILGMTSLRQPTHPLYLAGSTKPFPLHETEEPS